jgi:agmatine/peptidylarginine deiminase
MPLPYRNTFRTYVNSLLVNGTAVVPRYSRYRWNYDSDPNATLTKLFESKVTTIYKELGYRVRFVNADDLIFNGGAFHCIAVQIPKIDISNNQDPNFLKGNRGG